MRGELRLGDRLPTERDLAHELGISRASLREGIIHLSTLGVLKSVHGVGTFVGTGLDYTAFEAFSDIHSVPNWQMFEARLAIEPHIASLAAERATKKQIASMGEEIVEMSAVVNMPEQYHLHDVRFHRMLAVASGNPVLSALMETVAANVGISDMQYRAGDYSIDFAKLGEMHRKIYHSIRSRDPVGARLAMERHLHLSSMVLIPVAPEREVDLVAPVRDDIELLLAQAV